MEPFRHTNEPTSSLLNGNTSYEPKSDPHREKRSRARYVSQRSNLHSAAHSGLRILSLLFSLAIIGILAYTIIIYQRTKDENITSPHGYRLRAWPTRLKLYPTYVLLAAAASAASLNIGRLAHAVLWRKQSQEILTPPKQSKY
jgi:hypothetical protein